MCGIIGAFDPQNKLQENEFIRMRDLMTHRGPDDAGFFRDPAHPVMLGHRRLSIIDLSPAAHQPMGEETGTLWLTFNGEIYNFKELRTTLEKQGIRFRSHSDSEVILQGYSVWGPKVVEHLQGMFAFCIWDKNKECFFLARDRVGIKPLYYSHTPFGFVFASEIQPLIACPWVEHQLDYTSLADYLTFGYIGAPKSIWKQIKKLPAGFAGVFSLKENQFDTYSYWDFNFRPTKATLDPDSIKTTIQTSLTHAVESHKISDVPLGAFLSGGIDSSMVVAMLASRNGQAVNTFSIGFNENSHNELPLANRLAEKYQTNHFTKIIDLAKILERFNQVYQYFGEPFSDSSSIAVDFLSELTRRHVTVALSGDGGDELFGGYKRYLKMHFVEGSKKIPGFIKFAQLYHQRQNYWNRQKSFLSEVSMPVTEAFASVCSKIPGPSVKKLLRPDLVKEIGDYDPLEQVRILFQKGRDAGFDFWGCMRYVDAKTWLPEDILTKVDRVTMRHSLEARVPLLDHLFIEQVQTIPQELLIGKNFFTPKLKALFKKIARDFLPAEHFTQPKKGFGLPMKIWFKNLLYPDTAKIGLHNGSPFLNVEVKKILDLHRTGKKGFEEALWTMKVLDRWFGENL